LLEAAAVILTCLARRSIVNEFLPTGMIKSLEALSNEVRKHLARFVMESWVFTSEHKNFWLLPIIIVGLLLGTWAVFTEPLVEPYAHLGQR
jgi:hypothetical protein